jgi:hypothetical protein
MALILLFSCSHKETKNVIKNFSNKPNETVKIIDNKDLLRLNDDFKNIQSNLIIGHNYNIDGDNIIIRVGPSLNSEKLVNKKTSEIFNKTIYAVVDQSVKVKVEEINGYWTKIRITEPDWLSNTHIGWIPTYHIIGENKTDGKFLASLSKKFLISLLENIDNQKYIDSTLKNINFHEELKGIYKSNQEIGNKMKHILDINKITGMVILHTSDAIFWEKISNELKSIQKQESFNEGSYIGKRFINDKYIFETLKPSNGVNIQRNIFYDIYLYRTK